MRIEGTIKTPAGDRPPALRSIRVALNRGGRLSSRGLPVCQRQQIDSITSSEALAVCGPALVGGGSFTAMTALSNQSSVFVRGEILLFNGVVDGRPAILAHVFQTDPVPITRIMVLFISHRAGSLGTVITGQLPESLNRNGYLKSIFLLLHRHYIVHGQPRDYLSASCPAPSGFTAAVFPFARASMSFDDGRTLSSTLTRTCKVR